MYVEAVRCTISFRLRLKMEEIKADGRDVFSTYLEGEAVAETR